MQVGDLVRIQKSSKLISRWMIEARDNDIPMVIVGRHIDKSRHFAGKDQLLYEVIFQGAKWVVYASALERLSNANR